MLKHPDPNAPFIIQTDASDVAMGREFPHKRMPRACCKSVHTLLKKLTKTEQRWAVWEEEAYAVWWALLTWGHFLDREQKHCARCGLIIKI